MKKINVKKFLASAIAAVTVATGAMGMSVSAEASPSTGKWSYNTSEYVRIKSSSSAYCYRVFSTTGNTNATGSATYSYYSTSSSMNETIYYRMSMTTGNQKGKTYPLTYHRTGVTKQYLQVTHKYYK